MISWQPKVIDHSGTPFQIQYLETYNQYLLVYVRSDATYPGPHGTKEILALKDWYTLQDTHGEQAQAEHALTSGGGPFEGTATIAFKITVDLDLASPLTMASNSARLVFQIDPTRTDSR